MPRPPVARTAILALLKDAGKMTRSQIAEALAMPESTVKGALRSARSEKLIRVAGWWNPPLSERGNQRPMYGIGDGPDARLKKKTVAEQYRRYRAKHYGIILIKEEIRRRGPDNPFTQLITQCRSAPKKQRSAKA